MTENRHDCTPTKLICRKDMTEIAPLSLQTAIRSLARSALDLLLPLKCLGCREEGDVLCARCIEGLRRLEPPFCDTCAQPNVNGRCQWCLEHPTLIDGIRAPYLFEGPLREAVHRVKYQGWRAAAPVLGGLLAVYLDRDPFPTQPTGQVLVPVPLHPRSLRSRGYNQSYLLAKEAGKLLDMPVRQDLLKRTKDSPPQVEARSREQRRANVAGSFGAAAAVAGLSVLLVDDVATTGSTLSACATALKEAGAASVWGVVLARDS